VQLEKKGLVISERDLQIASIALIKRLCVVTHNTKEFNSRGKIKGGGLGRSSIKKDFLEGQG